MHLILPIYYYSMIMLKTRSEGLNCTFYGYVLIVKSDLRLLHLLMHVMKGYHLRQLYLRKSIIVNSFCLLNDMLPSLSPKSHVHNNNLINSQDTSYIIISTFEPSTLLPFLSVSSIHAFLYYFEKIVNVPLNLKFSKLNNHI